MSSDPRQTAAFYAGVQGRVATRLLSRRLARLWPALAGQSVLGVGFAAPYLKEWREQAARCVAAVPGCDAPHWPAVGANHVAAMADDAWPFPDLSFDRVLLVHGLETTDNARRLLREAWRVLRDDGRLMVVAPNRRGWWAYVETTPFGQGRPYSPGQLARLLADALFTVERRDAALFMPPFGWRIVLRWAGLWEAVGHAAARDLAGVTIAEAVKDAFSAMPLTVLPGQRVAGPRLVGVTTANLGSG